MAGRRSLSSRWLFCTLAGSDQQLHQVIVDFAAAGLDDEDIFVAHRLADLDTRLAHAELGEVDFGRRDAEVGADGFGELGVGRPGEEDDVAHHLCSRYVREL